MSSAATAGVASFLTGTSVFFVLKLTTSIDDVLWLSPFLALGDGDIRYKLHCGLLYGTICLLVTVEALLIDLAASYGVGALVKALGDVGDDDDDDDGEDESYWNASRLLCIFASIGIAAYACKEWKESREENDRDDDDGEEDRDGTNGRHGIDIEVEQERGGVEKELKTIGSEGYSSVDEEEPTIHTTPLSDSRSFCNSSDGEYKKIGQTEREGCPFADEEEGFITHQQEREQVLAEEEVSVHLPSHVRVNQDAKYDSLPNDEEASHTIAEGGHQETEKQTLSSLCVVAFFGTLDDLALFSAVLMGKDIHYISLLCGSMLAAAVIVLASWCVSLFQPFADVMQRIPLWALLFAIALYILIDGILLG